VFVSVCSGSSPTASAAAAAAAPDPDGDDMSWDPERDGNLSSWFADDDDEGGEEV